MVITVLEANVEADKTAILEAAYHQATQQLEPGIVQTFLLRNARAPEMWQIVTVWESREALEAMRSSGGTPRGILIFQAAQAEPALSIFGVAAHAQA